MSSVHAMCAFPEPHTASVGKIELPVEKDKTSEADKKKRKRIKKVNVEKQAKESKAAAPAKGKKAAKPQVTEKEIQKEIRNKLRTKGFKVDSRPFKPHLTIGRVKSPKNKDELIKVINNLSEYSCGVQEISSIQLKKSILKTEGPEYSVLYKVEALDKR